MGISVKSNELVDWDEELNLFDDEDWDFFDVNETAQNFEYFDDIRDIDFLDTHVKFKLYLPYIMFGILLAIGGIWSTSLLRSQYDAQYEAIKTNIASEESKYMDGKEASSEEYIELSKVMQNYCTTLHKNKGYKKLNDYMISGDSSFYRTYSDNIGNMKSTYDKYDCYSRALAEFGSTINCSRVDKIVENDGIYYAYVELQQPTKECVREYLNLHRYNAVKHFNTVSINEVEVGKFLATTLAENKISCDSEVVVLEFMEVADTFKLVDDSDITSICTTAYNYSLSQLSAFIGGSKDVSGR